MKSMAQHKGPNGPGSTKYETTPSEEHNGGSVVPSNTNTGLEADYDKVERDEQCDDWNGFPKPCL